jgi:hypothetical protein
MVFGIYKVERTDEADYDEYDSFVCAAASTSDAIRMHPCPGDEGHYCSWPAKPETLRVTKLGTALPYQAHGIILASFNAG